MCFLCYLPKTLLVRNGPSHALTYRGNEYAMGLLRLAVLGPPEIFHDSSRLTFSLRKAQALLLYLAVEGGMHSRSKLAAFLWPDSEPSECAQDLAQCHGAAAQLAR